MTKTSLLIAALTLTLSAGGHSRRRPHRAKRRSTPWGTRSLAVNPNMLGVELNIKHTGELLREQRGRSTWRRPWP